MSKRKQMSAPRALRDDLLFLSECARRWLRVSPKVSLVTVFSTERWRKGSTAEMGSYLCSTPVGPHGEIRYTTEKGEARTIHLCPFHRCWHTMATDHPEGAEGECYYKFPTERKSASDITIIRVLMFHGSMDDWLTWTNQPTKLVQGSLVSDQHLVAYESTETVPLPLPNFGWIQCPDRGKPVCGYELARIRDASRLLVVQTLLEPRRGRSAKRRRSVDAPIYYALVDSPLYEPRLVHLFLRFW